MKDILRPHPHPHPRPPPASCPNSLGKDSPPPTESTSGLPASFTSAQTESDHTPGAAKPRVCVQMPHHREYLRHYVQRHTNVTRGPASRYHPLYQFQVHRLIGAAQSVLQHSKYEFSQAPLTSTDLAKLLSNGLNLLNPGDVLSHW
jgi:hypothetical protein